MPEHYTKSTVEAAVWCNPCGRITRHRIDHGRRGPCLECMAKQQENINARKQEAAIVRPTQGRLF